MGSKMTDTKTETIDDVVIISAEMSMPFEEETIFIRKYLELLHIKYLKSKLYMERENLVRNYNMLRDYALSNKNITQEQGNNEFRELNLTIYP